MFGNLFSSKEKIDISWNELKDVAQLGELDKTSSQKPVLIFKHSTRCSISAMTLGRFERGYNEDAAFEPYFLDLISYRDVSNEVEKRYGVKHESPQAILIVGGKAVFHSSHMGISFDELNQRAQ